MIIIDESTTYASHSSSMTKCAWRLCKLIPSVIANARKSLIVFDHNSSSVHRGGVTTTSFGSFFLTFERGFSAGTTFLSFDLCCLPGSENDPPKGGYRFFFPEAGESESESHSDDSKDLHETDFVGPRF